MPISPIAAVLLNNGSCLVAAANALRTLGFTLSPLPQATAAHEVPMEQSEQPAEPLNRTTQTLVKRLGTSNQIISA